MRQTKKYILLFLFLAVTGLTVTVQGGIGAGNDKDLFDQARLALFDRKWDLALEQLNRLTEAYPHSTFYSQVLFYKGKCYEEKKMPQQALENYLLYLKVSQNESLREEATISMIDINFALYENKGEKKHLEEIVGYLGDKNQVVRYYAAFILGKARDKTFADKAVPILKGIVAKENDPDLVDRARITLMRINPKYLKQLATPKSLASRVVVIRVVDKGTKKETFTLNIPFVLAQLALDSLPQKEKKLLEKKGYNLDEILDTVVKTGEILRIESDETIFKIWIE
jgi:tetratricopeptide (TPR) repeat protein